MRRRLALLMLCAFLVPGCGGKDKMVEATETALPVATSAATEQAEPTSQDVSARGKETPEPRTTPEPVTTSAATEQAEPPSQDVSKRSEETPPGSGETPEPRATPLFVPRDENGNLIINEDLYASFTQTEFSLPSAPVVLIYHTHAEEAYRQTQDYVYEETGEGTYKTLDKTKSVVALGELLKQALEARGFTVLHDDTDVEPPEIKSAYSRSLEVMERYPEATVYIDLHRNTANVKARKDDVVLVDGKRCARPFFVVGTAVGTYEGEYDSAHDWQQNYALAKALTERLRAIEPRFALDIRLKVGRYNQHVSPYCMLIELGHNANTFEDAANTIPYLADALAATLVFDTE